MEKKIIGVDCDEVLCILMEDFIPKFCEASGLDVKYEEFKEYDLKKYFHITEEKYAKLFVEYCKENPKYLKLVPGAREALMKLSEKYRIILISGRDEKIWKEATEYWLNHNLNGVPYEKFIFANDRYCDNEVAKDRPVKSLLCQEEHISIFIDDRERYVLECAPVCEECILFGEYPWTYYGIKEPNVHYCKDWNAVLERLL